MMETRNEIKINEKSEPSKLYAHKHTRERIQKQPALNSH